MKLKLDECISARLKPTLQALGHDVDTVVDEGIRSEEDAIVAAIALQNERMLFTADKGLGDVRHYLPGQHPGIIVFRPKSSSPTTLSKFIEEFVRNHHLNEFAHCLVIVTPGNVRVRRE